MKNEIKNIEKYLKNNGVYGLPLSKLECEGRNAEELFEILLEYFRTDDVIDNIVIAAELNDQVAPLAGIENVDGYKESRRIANELYALVA